MRAANLRSAPLAGRLVVLLATLVVAGACGVGGSSGVRGQALAGPTCPVARPNDPACDPRPVAGAVIVVLNPSGQEAARATTDADGRYSVALPSGSYTLEPQPVQGLMGTAAPAAATVGLDYVTVDLMYDTGIR
jgi:hypothetical protein